MSGTKKLAALQDSVAKSLNSMPGVFSTVQWGGRAYKMPRPGGSKRKPKLLTHVCITRAGDALSVDFKLERDRAKKVVAAHDWIEPHPFRTLAPSGWVSATVKTKTQAKALIKLLGESRALYPIEPSPKRAKPEPTGDIARRIDFVMRSRKATE
jgi:hypothetical protein